MEIVALFAATALLLAGLGIYGTISYVVNEQRREIAIRLALGAQRGNILKMILRRGLGLAAAGVGLVWPVRSSFLTSWPDCSMACRLPICPPSLVSPLYLPLSRSPPAVSRHCVPCASIQSLRSTPNDFLALLEACLQKL
jgi:ABC-type antimicrobial peptide transport system permease subunit